MCAGPACPTAGAKMSDDLPARLRACVTLASAYKLMDEAAGEIEALRHDLDRSMAREHERLQEVERLRAEVGGLRLLLAAGVAGAALYRDDGELQDNTTMPFIDFRRDSPEVIAEKMMQRNNAALKETP